MSSPIISSIMALKELDILKESALFLAKTRPFMYGILMSLKWVPKHGITMGVGLQGNRPVFYYSPEFVKLVYSLSPQSVINVIKHEILHIALRHLDTKSDDIESRVIKDLVINGILRHIDPNFTPAVVPCPICTPISPSIKSYLDESKLVYSNSGKCKIPDEKCPHCHGSGDLGLCVPESVARYVHGSDNDVNCAGLFSRYKKIYGESPKALSEILREKYPKEEAEFLIKCFGSDSNSGLISVELTEDDESEHYIKACITAAANNSGNDPGIDKQLLLNTVSHQSKINWRKYLRNSICNAISIEYSPTRLKRNKRFGFSQPGVQKKYGSNVIVAIDTSASMSDKTLADIKGVVLGLKPLNVSSTILEFDTQVSAEYGVKQLNNSITGRGGTNLAVPLLWAIENSVSYGTSIFIFTDGHGPAEVDPVLLKGYKVYWMLTKHSTDYYINEKFGSEKNHKITKFDL